uniref:RING-type domain-containing protein n=1 Tax=Glossina pallidipes TaxID=7398 RepID=A0A1B0A9E8_GLOPL
MPCEDCHCQFTVFRRKRSCGKCKRYLCSDCLKGSRKIPICEICQLFSKRPLLRSDLMDMKSKDLIFYLQSKHISTAGCVEKEDLIGLVLQHIQVTDSSSSSSSQSSPHHKGQTHRSESFTPFEGIKQSCQNFFTNLSENISDSLSSFDTNKASAKPSCEDSLHTQQPRITIRELPTYAASQSRPPAINDDNQSILSNNQNLSSAGILDNNLNNNNNNNSAGHSLEAMTQLSVNLPQCVNHKDECDCSDDELINTFNERSRSVEDASHLPNNEADQFVTASTSTGGVSSKFTSQSSKLETLEHDEVAVQDDNNDRDEDESLQSSFEELGAIGGITDDSKTTTDTNSNNTDQWQILDLHIQAQVTVEGEHTVNVNKDENLDTKQPKIPLRTKKVSRRRSESYINRQRSNNFSEDEDELQQVNEPRLDGELTTASSNRTKALKSCLRCGKNKANIRQQVEKMRRHLESSQMSESDIKQELQDFLAYLEQRTKSIEYSDSESGVCGSSMQNAVHTTRQEVEGEVRFAELNEDEGINVYATSSDINEKMTRFANLEAYQTIQELECLSVKQLKEILMVNRVDFKGCCEKQELLERVERLWKDLKATPAVEKLPSDELCKICMDAPIECVILECGHMATCTNCGKVLCECPICRQYIVRVVRFFRA